MANLIDPVAYLADHYVYEINMLRQTFALLRVQPNGWGRNALMEAFAIHARALLDFYECQPKADDVVATAFTGPGAFSAGETAKLGTDIRRRINKQVPHLTASRENAQKIDNDDRLKLLLAIEADHGAFKAAVRPEFAGCFGLELPLP